ncbi:MAG TPA: sugar MFS transporter [Acidisarcina sp.]|nr:sugar MFS transporter [Acidisarcina sp.]
MAAPEAASNSVRSGNIQAAAAPMHQGRSLAIVTSLFFLWGFITSLNDILVPHLKSIFELNYTQVMLVQFAFFSAYFLFSLPWARVIDKIGYQQTMVAGLLTMGFGAFLFIPAASVPSFPMFLVALLILAAGITGLQVAANPYVIALGKPETGSSRLTLTQAFNSLGTTLAPKIGGLLILGTAVPLALEKLRALTPAALHAYRLQEAATIKMPYISIGIVLVLLGLTISRLNLPKIPHAHRPAGEKVPDSLWKHPNLIFGTIGIFTYVGAEVSIGSFLVSYLGQPNIAGFSPPVAAGYVSFYWGGAMVGRFIGAGLLQRVKTRYLLATCTVCTTVLVVTSMLSSGHLAMWTLLAVGLFNSIMFPSIFTLGVAELGPLTGAGSGVMNMAIVGGAIVPVIQGAIADRIGIHHAFFVALLCYLYIFFYATRESKPNSERHAKA